MLLFCHRWHPTQTDRGFALRHLYVQPAPLVHRCPLRLGVRVSWLQMWRCKTDWWDVVTFNHRNGMMICTDIQIFQGGSENHVAFCRSDGPVAKRLAQQEFAADHRLPGNASDAKFLATERERWQFLCQGPGEFHDRSVILAGLRWNFRMK